MEVALRFLIEEVGEVKGVYPAEGNLSEASDKVDWVRYPGLPGC